MSIPDETIVHVSAPTPIDVSMVRDPGMKALIILAVSLGWNAHHKLGQPVVITARDGFQKRLPTNTSIRMSVFQTTLAAILFYSASTKATPELMEAIIKMTKLDAEHARRMRTSLGDTDVELNDRIVNSGSPDNDFQPLEPQDYEEQWSTRIGELKPAEIVDHRPSEAEFEAWTAQLNALPGARADRRGSMVFLYDRDDEVITYWCSFPGCRFHTDNQYATRGHNRAHTSKWGPMSDHENATRAQRLRVAARHEPEPEFVPVEAETMPTSQEVEHPIDLIERYTADALALLEITNRFVNDLDEITRLSISPDELAELRRKAMLYDQLMMVLNPSKET